MSVSRRQFIRNSSYVLVGAPFFGALADPLSTHELHTNVAKRVKSKWGTQNKTLRVFYPKGCLGNLEPVCREFYKLTSVKVSLKEASLDQISSEMILKSRLRKENYDFDVALPATFGIPDLVEAGIIADLSEFADKYEPGDFSKNSLYRLGDRFRGRLYGYQTDGDAYLMFYNKKWMDDERRKKSFEDQHGKPLQLAKTWTELDQQIRFFHQPEKGEYGGSLFRNKNYIAWEFWIRLHAKGLYPVGDDMSPRIQNPLAIEALEELISTTKYLHPSVTKDGLFENFKSFSKGDKFCNIGWGGTQKFLNGKESQMRSNLYLRPTPGGTTKDGKSFCLPYFNWGWNYVVSSTSKHKELAYLFTLFACSPQISIYAVREPDGYFDPFRQEHYEDPEIQKTYGVDFLKAHRQSLEGSIPDFYLRGQGSYLGALKQGVFAASTGQVGAKRALQDVATRWEQITEKLGRTSQQSQWKFLKASYPKSLKEVLSS